MNLRSFAHKGLKKLYLDDSANGVPSDAADKLRKMLAFLEAMEYPDELQSLPMWKAHILTVTGEEHGV